MNTRPKNNLPTRTPRRFGTIDFAANSQNARVSIKPAPAGPAALSHRRATLAVAGGARYPAPVSEQSGRRQRRRRGGRGGQNRPQGEGQPRTGQQPPGPQQPQPQPPQPDARTPRQDTRRGRGPERPRTPPGPPGPASGGRIQRAPSSGDRPARVDRAPSEGRPRGGSRDRGPQRERDRGPRVLEPPVPQDERSVELGAMFREAQTARRDARKALDKRKAEFSDEPEWMLEALHAAEKRFEEVATEWSDHLAKTGRKFVRR